MRNSYLVATVVTFSVLTAVAAQAGNSASVLQFGQTNNSFISQTGSTSNSATTMQFGATNTAVTLQTGSLLTVNSSVIGQGGTTATAFNTALAGQVGGSNSSLIGQIGANNTAGVGQLGILNGSTILQQAP
jgi:hypothetical protein